MIRQILLRIGFGLLIVWLAVTLAFFVLAVLPGDAIASQLTQSRVDPAVIEMRQVEAGLNDPVGLRYLRFLIGAVRGDLGVSLLSGEPVITAIARNLPPTFALAVGALTVAAVIGLILGLAAALRVRYLSWLSQLVINLTLSMPIYWTGTLAIYVFTVRLGILPSAGAGRLNQLILPMTVLGFHAAGAIARIAQGNIQQAMTADFVRTAQAKGLSKTRILSVHVLRVAMPPVISVMALQAGFLMSGTVITESIFVRPGIGRLLLESVIQQDYPIVLGVVIFSAAVYTVLSLIADFVVHLLDPRVVF